MRDSTLTLTLSLKGEGILESVNFTPPWPSSWGEGSALTLSKRESG